MVDEYKQHEYNKVTEALNMLDEVCELHDDCKYCPLCNDGCKLDALRRSALHHFFPITELKGFKDDECDTCHCPTRYGCQEKMDCTKEFPIGECCKDNLERNVGEICFHHGLSEVFAAVLVEVIRKERERNESVFVHR